jgi:vacuolar-type H+-ATPase subunit H
MLTTKSKSKHVQHNVRSQAKDLADRLAPHVETARDKAGPALAEVREKAGPLIADARDRARPVITEAREKAGPLIADAREKAGPMLADARDKAGPVLAETRHRWESDVRPAVLSAVAAADEASEPYREEALRRGKAAAAALRGEVAPAPKKKRGLRRFMMLLALAGVGALVAKMLSDRKAATAWQSSYQPAPAPPPAPSPAPPATDDEAASSPGEAIADSADTPHQPTNPDAPAEQVDIDKE